MQIQSFGTAIAALNGFYYAPTAITNATARRSGLPNSRGQNRQIGIQHIVTGSRAKEQLQTAQDTGPPIIAPFWSYTSEFGTTHEGPHVHAAPNTRGTPIQQAAISTRVITNFVFMFFIGFFWFLFLSGQVWQLPPLA
jgi:hypothetical protein